METNNRRDFLKKAALAGASALVAPSLFAADGEGRGELSPKIKAGDLESKLIVPKNNGLKITGTFLDEISHDIPHQNWGYSDYDSFRVSLVYDLPFTLFAEKRMLYAVG